MDSGEKKAPAGQRKGRIAVVDNGTQYGWLYVMQLRELGAEVDFFNVGVFTDDSGKVQRPPVTIDDLAGYSGAVIAGGKSSVTGPEELRPALDPAIYSFFQSPLLLTCYGHQDCADRLGGRVKSGLIQCGPVHTAVDTGNLFFSGLSGVQRVNSTHNDGVFMVPEGFTVIAESVNVFTGYRNVDAMFRPAEGGKHGAIISTQFHPETFLTENGKKMLNNFIQLCGLQNKSRIELSDAREENITKENVIKENVIKENINKKGVLSPELESMLREQMGYIREKISGREVFFPISGGIDSTVAMAMLLEEGIDPGKIHAFHIDSGYNRLGESDEVIANYHAMAFRNPAWGMIEKLDKRKFFAGYSAGEEGLPEQLQGKRLGGMALRDATQSEHKRFLFREAYHQVMVDYMKEKGLTFENSVMVQGTNQADKVESGKGGMGKGSAHIKSHHNVGGPSDRYTELGLLVEPLQVFYKNHIYAIGQDHFDLPAYFRKRKPFPGPGLVVRTATHHLVEKGVYTWEEVEELERIANKYLALAVKDHALAVRAHLSPFEAVGTFGDERAEGIFSVLSFRKGHESKIYNHLDLLRHHAGQIPHYTTLGNGMRADAGKCITRFITPLFDFQPSECGSVTEFRNDAEHMRLLQIFDDEVNRIVGELCIPMTQVVNYVLADSLGQEGKRTFVFRPWKAPDLMTGYALIPDGKEMPVELIGCLKALKSKYGFIGNICLDLTYKPIGGTEIN